MGHSLAANAARNLGLSCRGQHENEMKPRQRREYVASAERNTLAYSMEDSLAANAAQ